MAFSRRDFVKICTGAVAGFGISQMYHPWVNEVLSGSTAANPAGGARPSVFWLQGQACTGCSVSVLNNVHPGVAKLLLDVISLDFQPTLMAAEGSQAYRFMMERAQQNKGGYILLVEGSIPTEEDGKYCIVAEDGPKHLSMAEVTKNLAEGAAAVAALGACASFGGIPAARGSVTGAKGVIPFLKQEGIKTPVINIPGCPPHPDWVVGTLVLALQAINTGTLGLFASQNLDALARPKAFYGRNVHMNCPYLPYFMSGTMCKNLNDKEGCRYDLGCKGPKSACDSFERLWNNRSNWCVANGTCVSCTSKAFPDGRSPFYENPY